MLADNASMSVRSKYDDSYIKEAEELCTDKGLTDEAIAGHFGIAARTLYDWKRQHLKFAEAIQRGKDAFDTRVVESKLLQRACGYHAEEETRTLEPTTITDPETGKTVTAVELIITKVVRKHIIPDVGAISLWLKNRNPKRWREIQHIIEDQPEELTVEQAEKLLEELKHAGNGLSTE